jgi:hypothetical protein
VVCSPDRESEVDISQAQNEAVERCSPAWFNSWTSKDPDVLKYCIQAGSNLMATGFLMLEGQKPDVVVAGGKKYQSMLEGFDSAQQPALIDLDYTTTTLLLVGRNTLFQWMQNFVSKSQFIRVSRISPVEYIGAGN